MYALRLPDGGDLRFYRRLQMNPDEGHASLAACHVLFGNQMALIGLELQRDGETLSWRAEWKAERNLDDDYAVYLHFTDADGRLFPQDHRLTFEGRGTKGLKQGERFREEYVIPLTPEIRDLPSLRVGVYEPSTFSKFPVLESTFPVLERNDGILVKLVGDPQ